MVDTFSTSLLAYFVHRLTSQIGYVPLTKPKPPSQLRRLAYQENVPVLGPDVDPQGWKAFQDVEIKGKLFKAVDVNVTCSVCPILTS